MENQLTPQEFIIKEIDPDLFGLAVSNSDLPQSFRVPYVNIGDKILKTGWISERKKKGYEIIHAKPFNFECKHYTACGGCIGQQFPYEQQFLLKTNSLVNQFQKQFQIQPILVPAENPYFYRNRMDFMISPGPMIGLRELGNFRKIINIEKCFLQTDWANNVLNQFKKVLYHFPDLPYNRSFKNQSGYLKYLTLRKSMYSKETMVIFSLNKTFKNLELKKKLADQIAENINAENILFCYTQERSEASALGEVEIMKGKIYYEENLNGQIFKVPFNSFFQPNPIQFEFIHNFILEKIKNESTLIDFFCGNGYFSFILENQFQNILGFDCIKESIQVAEDNLKNINPRKNFEFRVFDLYSKKIFELLEEVNSIKNKILILDPPRNGLSGQFIEFVSQMKNNKSIFYVSCNPKKQLEDLKILSTKYHLEEILITDPFPQTAHLESVAYLTPKNN